jgi:hypothetical protein
MQIRHGDHSQLAGSFSSFRALIFAPSAWTGFLGRVLSQSLLLGALIGSLIGFLRTDFSRVVMTARSERFSDMLF